MEGKKSAKPAHGDRVSGNRPQLALVRASLYTLPPVKQRFLSRVAAEVMAAKWAMLSLMVAGVLGGIAYTMVQTPLFEAHASIEVQGDGADQTPTPGKRSLNDSQPRADTGSTLETQVRILQSRGMIQRALNHLPEAERQQLVDRPRLGRAVPDLLESLQARLTVTPSAQAHIIDIGFLSGNAQAGANFLNTLAQELSDYSLERQWKAAQRSGDWLQPQLNDVRSKLEASEKALDEYSRGGSVALSTNGSEVENQWALARTDRIARQMFYEHLQSSAPNKVAEISGDSTLRELQRESDDLQAQITAATAGQGEGTNSQVTSLRGQWRGLQQDFDGRRTSVINQAKADYVGASQREKSLEAQLSPARAAQLEAAARTAPEKTTRYALLKQEADANRQLYESLATRVTEAGIANSLKTRTILLLDSAYPAHTPVSPNGALDALTGLGAGTLAGLLFVLLRKLLSPTFSQPGTLSRVLSLPELGAVPVPDVRMNQGVGPVPLNLGIVPFHASDDGGQNESYRAIRSSLLYQSGESVLRCLVFTSATAGEGKTTVVTNLSMSLAATNRKVLIIDGDMRRPKLHKTFGTSPSPGLSDLLRRDRLLGTSGNATFVVETPVPNLFLLPCGTMGGDAPELLAGDRLPTLLNEFRKNFDLVMIDTPPLLPCADARSFAKAADGVILIVRANETDRREAGVARDTLLQDGSPVIGTVLTGFHARRGAYGYPGYSTTA